ncbi:MAG: hypothetical protein JJE39_15020 [Vicinamibacteria bacterium]|nr:hypothetical protein [Vicinamibacteria bacterium]
MTVGGTLTTVLFQDLRYALRGLARSPGFAFAALVSIAIGIGDSTAIFTVVNALLVRPLPYADAERLVLLWNRLPGLNIAEDWFSTAQYLDIKSGHTDPSTLAGLVSREVHSIDPDLPLYRVRIEALRLD